MEHPLAKLFESHHERGRIFTFNAKPETGVVAEIGMGLMFFKAKREETLMS